MAKKKPPKSDPNQLAAFIVAQSTESTETISPQETPEELAAAIKKAQEEGKDPLAVLLGQRGGLRGGPARAKSLSKARRSEIAKKAAKARWGELTKQTLSYESLLQKREELTKQIESIDNILALFAPEGVRVDLQRPSVRQFAAWPSRKMI